MNRRDKKLKAKYFVYHSCLYRRLRRRARALRSKHARRPVWTFDKQTAASSQRRAPIRLPQLRAAAVDTLVGCGKMDQVTSNCLPADEKSVVK